MTTVSRNEKGLSDYLYTLYKWKKLIIINLSIIFIVATIYSFSIPETYKSKALMMIPQEKEFGIGNLLSDNSALSFGASLLGSSSPNMDLILGLLNSRNIMTKVINKFNLFYDYNITDRNYDKVIKSFKDDLIFTPNEFGLLEIYTINKNPQKSADISNYFAYLADSLNIVLKTENAKNNRKFIEKRFLQNQIDLENAEVAYHKFQLNNGVFDIPEQIKVAVQAAGELEKNLIQKEIYLNSISNQINKNSPQYKDIEYQILSIRQKLGDFKNKNEGSYFLSFKKIPDLSFEYLRLFRELEIQSKIKEFLYPMYEQAKIDEQKSIPTLIVVDKAVPPQLKYGPKKALVIITIFSIFLLVTILFIFRADNLKNIVPRNPLLEKEKRFYNFLEKFYKIKTDE
ncbi:MAG: hypothetical protein HYS24_01080 [Ignavibacteriales bacterium]|nr:hypothetical protein [Ignavibacteriales bacterium]